MVLFIRINYFFFLSSLPEFDGYTWFIKYSMSIIILNIILIQQHKYLILQIWLVLTSFQNLWSPFTKNKRFFWLTQNFQLTFWSSFCIKAYSSFRPHNVCPARNSFDGSLKSQGIYFVWTNESLYYRICCQIH